MRNVLFVIFAVQFTIACGSQSDDVASVDAVESAQIDESPLSGKQAYEQVCASCHESGANGAPVTSNQDQWRGRSQNWQSVLMGHAKKGYLRMPAKGGQTELSDWVVDAATEYMLSQTYPDRLSD